MQPGTSAATLLPMVLFQNMSTAPPNSLLQVAVKNNQQPVLYFSDKISLHVFFTEDGRMERGSFLEVRGRKNLYFLSLDHHVSKLIKHSKCDDIKCLMGMIVKPIN